RLLRDELVVLDVALRAELVDRVEVPAVHDLLVEGEHRRPVPVGAHPSTGQTAIARDGEPVPPTSRSGMKSTQKPSCRGMRSMFATISVWTTQRSACVRWFGYERSPGKSVLTASVQTLTTPWSSSHR